MSQPNEPNKFNHEQYNRDGEVYLFVGWCAFVFLMMVMGAVLAAL